MADQCCASLARFARWPARCFNFWPSMNESSTHVAIDKLKAVHALTHPARLTRVRSQDGPSPGPSADRGAEALLATLAGEAEDDEV